MNGSPLGRFAAPAAAIASLAIIAVALFSLVYGHQLGVDREAQSQLNLLAALAAGALFGSSVAVNGYKAPIEAAHRRIDGLYTTAAGNRAGLIAVAEGTDVKAALAAGDEAGAAVVAENAVGAP